jgi:hypothetical protein
MSDTPQTPKLMPDCTNRIVVGSSDTPETDERAFHAWRWDTHKMDYTPYGEVVTSTFARRIELERNRLKDEVAFAWKSKAKADDYIQTLKNKISHLENKDYPHKSVGEK